VDGDAAALACGFERSDGLDGDDFGDVVVGGAHLHGADGDFVVLGVDDAVDAGLAAEGFEFDESPGLMARGLLERGFAAGRGIVLSAPVLWATTVELNCSENSRFARAMRRSESRAIFCARALSSMALTVSRAGRRSLHEGVELGFELFGAGLLFGAAFDLERAFSREALRSRCCRALAF
jgi:hypothetical protein